MTWFYLIIAGVFEVVWAISLQKTNGFTRLMPSILTVLGMGISFYFLSLALKALPIGTAYAVWTGIGIAGTAAFGMLFMHEPVNASRMFFVACILIGIVGLKWTSG